MSGVTSKDFFGKNASNYASSPIHRAGPSLPILIELAAPVGTDVALDIATGTGHTAIALAPYVDHITGLDLTPRMLEEARRLVEEKGLTNTTFVEGSAEALPFLNKQFSLVTARHAPHHFHRVDQFLAEVLRTLKPGGRFVMSDQISPTTEVFDWVDFWERTRDPSHYRQRTIEEWKELATVAGFNWGEEKIVPYRLEFAWWVKTAGANRYAISALENHAASADPATRKSMGLEYDESGKVVAFHEPMLVVKLEA